MLISNVCKSIIVMNSRDLDTRFSRNVFEVVLKTRSACFIMSKTTRLRLVVLNPENIDHHEKQIIHTLNYIFQICGKIYITWSACACRPMTIGLDHPGTSRGMFLQMIASLNTVPPRILRIVPLGDFHIFFKLNSGYHKNINFNLFNNFYIK